MLYTTTWFHCICSLVFTIMRQNSYIMLLSVWLCLKICTSYFWLFTNLPLYFTSCSSDFSMILLQIFKSLYLNKLSPPIPHFQTKCHRCCPMYFFSNLFLMLCRLFRWEKLRWWPEPGEGQGKGSPRWVSSSSVGQIERPKVLNLTNPAHGRPLCTKHRTDRLYSWVKCRGYMTDSLYKRLSGRHQLHWLDCTGEGPSRCTYSMGQLLK